jgi:hypothetical protein
MFCAKWIIVTYISCLINFGPFFFLKKKCIRGITVNTNKISLDKTMARYFIINIKRFD